jgi:hypothetical protein
MSKSHNPVDPVDTTSIPVVSNTPDATTHTDTVEALAEALHNAQVDQLRKQADDSGDSGSFSYSTWYDLTDASKESRRSTARFLLEHFTITAK